MKFEEKTSLGFDFYLKNSEYKALFSKVDQKLPV